jgi:glycosyltransferase involved in cell wall biosynthesis
MKIIAVMPAFNAARTIEATVREMPPGSVDEIIVVDDASRDDTVAIARRLGLTVLQHDANQGYGANQKTCYRTALEHGADIVVMIHPDYQYDSRLTPYFTGFLRDKYFDVMLGSRIRTRREAMDGGMPAYKYVANRCMTIVENVVTGMNLAEWHTGFRAYTRTVLETIPWTENSDDFVFDSQFLLQCIAAGFRIGEIPVPVRYYETSSSINFRRSLTYGLRTMQTLGTFALHQLHLISSPLFRGSIREHDDKR